MNVAIIIGSVRQPSLTRVLCRFLADCFTEKSISISWVDLRENPLPITDPDYHHDVSSNPSLVVREFVKTVDQADGIILASPLYQGSYSGVLKNAIDNLAYDAFLDKAVGLVSNGSSAKKCTIPCEHLVPVVRTLYGYPLQCQVAACKDDFISNDDGESWELADQDVKERCRRLVNEMVAYLQSRSAVK